MTARDKRKILEEVLAVLKKNGYKGLAAKVEALLAHDLPAESGKSA